MTKKFTNKKNVVRAVVIIGVIIIPLMYSFFYLDAFWDPYSRLDSLPVAVVNNDAGMTINSKERNLGSEICDKLEDSKLLKFIFTDEKVALDGTKGKDYYATIVIPKDFSKDIASASEVKKQTATITFSPNEKKNYLASQILSRAVLEIEESTRESITKEIVNTLTDQVDGVPTQMNELKDGLGKLSDGSNKLATGTNDLKLGTSEFATKFNQYAAGITGAQSGAQKIKDGANTLSSSTSQFKEGVTAYTAGVNSLINNTKDTAAFIGAFVKSHPELMKDPTFAAFIQKASSPENAKSIAELQGAGALLETASAKISAGTANLATGAKSLNDGMSKISGASDQLNTAAKKISTGAAALNDGTKELNNGVNTAKTGVDSSINDATKQLSALDGLSDFASKPVKIETTSINKIPNYGVAFAPYFMSLSLWVGALIIFFAIYLDPDQRFSILSRNSNNKMARSFLYLLIGAAQGLALGTIIVAGLGLNVEHMWLFFLSISLVSAVFISIVQFCLVHLGDGGKFIAMLLLILQLTSCGGTFPMEIVPKFFNALFPFMPMTYSVSVFKDAISGEITSTYWLNILVLFVILLVVFTATVLLSLHKKANKNQNLVVEASN